VWKAATSGRSGIDASVDSLINRLRQVLIRGFFFEQQASTGIQERFSIPIVDVKGEADDRQVRMFPYDATGRFDPVHSRHVNVHHNDIGLQQICQLHRLLPIRRLTHQFNVEMMAKTLPQPLPDEKVVVHQ